MELRNELVASDYALNFLGALVASQALDAENVLEVIQSPWKWQREWQLWLGHGMPRHAEDTGFEAWCVDVDRAA